MGNCFAMWTSRTERALSLPSRNNLSWREISENGRQLSRHCTSSLSRTVRNFCRSHQKQKHRTGSQDLPSELWILIFNQLTPEDILTCRKISRLLYRMIDDIWYHIPRPRMAIYLRFCYETKPETTLGTLKEFWDFELQGTTDDNRIFWIIHVNTMYDFYNDNACKEFKFTYYENGTLAIREPYRLRSASASASRKLELYNCRDILRARGFSGQIRKFKNLRDEIKYELRMIKFPNWMNALEECLRMLLETRYRLRINAQDDSVNEDMRPDLAAIQQFHEIIEEVVRRQPVTVDMYYLGHFYSQWLTPIFYDSLRKIKDQLLTFTRNYDIGIGRIGWAVEMDDPQPQSWSVLHYKTAFKQRDTGRQVGFLRDYCCLRKAHILTTQFAVSLDHIRSLLEMAISHVIELEVDLSVGSIVPEIVQTYIRQWFTGERVIKRFTINLRRYLPSHRDYRLNIMELLKEFSPECLGRRADYIERFWISRTSPGINGILIQLEYAPSSISSRFAYVIQEATSH